MARAGAQEEEEEEEGEAEEAEGDAAAGEESWPNFSSNCFLNVSTQLLI